MLVCPEPHRFDSLAVRGGVASTSPFGGSVQVGGGGGGLFRARGDSPATEPSRFFGGSRGIHGGRASREAPDPARTILAVGHRRGAAGCHLE